MPTLLEKAKAVVLNKTLNPDNAHTDEELELVIAFLNGEVRQKAYETVLPESVGSYRTFTIRVLKWAVQMGKLQVVK